MVLPGWLPWYQFQLRSINRISPLFLADSKLSHEGLEWYFMVFQMASKPSCSGHFGSRLRLFLPKPPTPGPIQMPCRSVQRLTKLNIRWSVDSLGPRWSEITQKIVVVAGGQWSKLSHRELLQHAATLSVPGAQRPIGIVGLLGSGDVPGRLVFSRAQA